MLRVLTHYGWLLFLPFFIAGTLKVAYGLLLYRGFAAVQPPEA